MSRGKMLTRSEVPEWFGGWNTSDRRLVQHAVDLLPAGTVFRALDGEVRGLVHDDLLIKIFPGYLSWPKGTWATKVDTSLVRRGLMRGQENDGTLWAQLSTYQDR